MTFNLYKVINGSGEKDAILKVDALDQEVANLTKIHTLSMPSLI